MHGVVSQPFFDYFSTIDLIGGPKIPNNTRFFETSIATHGFRSSPLPSSVSFDK